MNPERSFHFNPRSALLSIGVITLLGNILLTTKIWQLWPYTITIFFSCMDIYLALHSMIQKIIS